MKTNFEEVKNTASRLAGRILVHKCGVCETEVKERGELCPECAEKYLEEKRHGCKYCHMTAPLCVCSNRSLKYSRSFGRSLYSMMFYDLELGAFNSMIFKFKRNYDRSFEIFFAKELAGEIKRLAEENQVDLSEWNITFPPRSYKGFIKYGFDQSEGLAKRIADITGMTFEKPIRRRVLKGNLTQKFLSGSLRRVNAEESYLIKEGANVKSKRYIIVDDIIASGATVKQCQKLLLKHGAKEVFPVSIAKTYYKGEGFDAPVKKEKRPDTAWFMD